METSGMRRQQIYLIKSKRLGLYNLADITFNENVVLIIYDKFTVDLYKYIYLPNIFLIPKELFDQYKNNVVTIDGNIIRSGFDRLANDCTLNGKSYLPKDILDADKMTHYADWFNSKVPYSYENFEELLPKLHTIPVTNKNYNNVLARLTRMKDFGQPKLSEKLRRLFNSNVGDFLAVQSLSIQAHDFSSKTLDIKIKLNESVFVYEPDGYHSYIDTLTKYYFYNDGDDLEFIKLLSKHPIPVVFFGILNYNLSNNIHKKTNRFRKIYRLLLAKLNEIQASQIHS